MERPNPLTPERARSRSRRIGTLLLIFLLILALLGTGCTGALRSDEDSPAETTEPSEELAAWPDDEPVAQTTSPAHPDLDLEVRPLLREPDGTATAIVDVTNQGPEPTDVFTAFGSDGLDHTRIIDPESRVRHSPLVSGAGSSPRRSTSPRRVPPSICPPRGRS